MKIRSGIILLFSFFILTSCKYQKLLKSKDYPLKYEAVNKYFEEGEYFKAYPLFEELIAVYRGTDKAEKLFYNFAYSDFYLKDYVLAGYRFSNFVKTFPNSELVEECQFMEALCYYKNSPKYSLDQSNTLTAISKMQLFTDMYPTSNYVDTCNVLIDKMLFKLERKNYEIAEQYLKTENYKSSITSFENLLERFPDTEYRENAYYAMFESKYFLGKKSIETKKLERIDNAIKAYINFVDSFPESELVKKAEILYEDLLKEKEKFAEKKI